MPSMAKNDYHDIAQAIMSDENAPVQTDVEEVEPQDAGAEGDAQAAAIETLLQRFEADENLSPEEYKTLIQYMRDVGSEKGEDNVQMKSDPQGYIDAMYEYSDEDEIAYMDSLSPEELQQLMQQIADSDGLGRVRSFMPKQ